jgi:hypothetical protein
MPPWRMSVAGAAGGVTGAARKPTPTPRRALRSAGDKPQLSPSQLRELLLRELEVKAAFVEPASKEGTRTVLVA